MNRPTRRPKYRERGVVLTENDLSKVLTLEEMSERHFVSPVRVNEANPSGRVYGGQLMGQLAAAALRTVPPERMPSSLQIAFLAGARPELQIDYRVTPLQDGKRVSTRHVRASQGELEVASSLVSCHAAAAGEPVGHARSVDLEVLRRGPESGRTLLELGSSHREVLGRSGFLLMEPHARIECRFADPERDLFPVTSPRDEAAQVHYWVRIRHPLPASTSVHLQAASLAYVSDWWFPFVAAAPYLGAGAHGEGGMYMATLNHTLWFHAPCRADEWLLFVTASPWAGAARGLSLGRIYNPGGTLVASMAQECLQLPRSH